MPRICIISRNLRHFRSSRISSPFYYEGEGEINLRALACLEHVFKSTGFRVDYRYLLIYIYTPPIVRCISIQNRMFNIGRIAANTLNLPTVSNYIFTRTGTVNCPNVIRPYLLLAVKERRGSYNFRDLARQRAIMENGTRRRDEFE